MTSFLMTEKSVESIDENGEKETLTGLVAIDHQQFNTRVSYQNQNQPTAPPNCYAGAGRKRDHDGDMGCRD